MLFRLFLHICKLLCSSPPPQLLLSCVSDLIIVRFVIISHPASMAFLNDKLFKASEHLC